MRAWRQGSRTPPESLMERHTEAVGRGPPLLLAELQLPIPSLPRAPELCLKRPKSHFPSGDQISQLA